MPRFFGQVILGVLVGFSVATVLHIAMWSGPSLLYKIRQPSTRSECSAIHADMHLSDVERLIHSRGWPSEESITESQFTFGSWEVCMVQIDPAAKTVLGVQLQEEPKGVQ